MKVTSAGICLLLVVASFVASDESSEDQDDLIGRPDGHEPYEGHLIGRPDGHQLYDKPLIGRPDGHELYSDSEEDSSSDSSEEYVPEEVVDEDSEAEEPLVRCKRPMCAMYCEFGFKKDSTGCPICECLEAAETPLIGRPDGHEAPPSCDGRPLCRMFCEFGFKRDEDGCEYCSCLADPCLTVRCGPGLQCKHMPCESLRSCNKLPAKCVAMSTHEPCAGPEPMCANYCPHGYRRDDNGCMTCDCVVKQLRTLTKGGRPRCRGPQPMCAAPCPQGYIYKPDGCMTCDCAEQPDNCLGSKPCEEGQICRNRTVSGVTKPTCTVKTLCEMERVKPIVLGSGRVECEPDGSFKPLQCTSDKSKCWCVDGLGKEVPDTRTSVYVSGHKPNCVRNVTVSMHIHMVMVVERHIDITKLDSLHTLIVEHVSSWLLIEPHYVTVVKAEAKKSDNIENIEEETSVVVVEVVVVHDGLTDLPSAGKHMKDRMDKGLCHIPVEGGGSLKPDPQSVNVHHKFAQYHVTTPQLIVDYEHHSVRAGHYRDRAVLRLTLCAVSAIVLVIVIIAVVNAIVQRKRRNRLAELFKHQMLVSPTISEKDLLGNEYVAEPVATATEPVTKEKEPVA